MFILNGKINLIAEIGVNHNNNKKLGKNLSFKQKKLEHHQLSFKLLKQKH